MRKILHIDGARQQFKYKSKPILVVAIRERRRFLSIRGFDKCDTEFACHKIRIPEKPQMLLNADVFVSIHGADMVNAFAVRPSCKIIEVMPVKGLKQCDCRIYSKYFTKYGYNYTQVWSTHRSNGGGSYSDDVIIDWSDIRKAISSYHTEITVNTSVRKQDSYAPF